MDYMVRERFNTLGNEIDLHSGHDVSADQNPRLFAAVVFQSENQVVVNSGYRAADIFACVDACSRVNR